MMAETIDRPQVQLVAPDLDTEDFKPDLTLEHELLGTLLVYEAQGRSDVFDEIRAALAAEDFFFPAHQTIWREICDLKARGLPATPKAIAPRVEGVEGLEIHGAAGYIRALSEGASLFDREMQWAALELRRKRLCRGAMEAAARLYEAARDAQTDGDPEVAIATAERALTDLHVEGPARKAGSAAERVLRNAEARAEGALPPVIPTGLAALDRLIIGAPLKGVTVLAGRPAMGKTAAGGWIGYNAATRYLRTGGTEGCPVLFFSLEMDEEQLTSRLMAIHSGYPYQTIHAGHVEPWQFERLDAARAHIDAIPLRIIDDPGLTVSDIAAKISAHRRRNPDNGRLLVIVDYLQFIEADDRYAGNRAAEVAEISKRLKSLAKREGIALIALAQLNRATETRSDPTPQLSDLKESGAVEQDAEAVIFIHRPEYYLEKRVKAAQAEKKDTDNLAQALENVRGQAKLIVDKNRMGPTGIARVQFDLPTARFSEIPRGML